GLYPGRADAFDAALADTLADLPDGAPEYWGVQLGRMSAEAILAVRQGDGWDEVVTHPGGEGVGVWRPTLPNNAPALLPQWGAITPFAMDHPAQFRSAGPPPISSAVYAIDQEEVRRLGRVDSTERTADQTEIALFWADGAGTATPPGHWFQIAQDVARQR